jgi:hypothetical protein
MERLNPATGKPFETGEIRVDGKQFLGYARNQPVKKSGYYQELWVDAENYTMQYCLKSARARARDEGLDFNIDKDYLLSIKTTHCPVFGTPFEWARMGDGLSDQAPSLDKIIPELGYVKGNVVFISHRANKLKNDATEYELYTLADWLHYKTKEVSNAFPHAVTSLSKRANRKSPYYIKSGVVFTTGLGQDDNHTDDHSRAVQRQDADHSPQTSGGDSVGQRSEEVGTSEAFTRIEDHGDTRAEVVRLDFGSRHLLNKP